MGVKSKKKSMIKRKQIKRKKKQTTKCDDESLEEKISRLLNVRPTNKVMLKAKIMWL